MPASQRYQRIDSLRGIAILLMIFYHFSYDLSYFKLAHFDFYNDPFWLHLRTIIVSLFLGLVGVSLVLATQNGIDPRRYGRRLAWLVVLALAITVNSYFMFPNRVIVFGILHFIAFASVAGLLFVRLYWPSLILGIAIVLLDVFFRHPFFDQYWIHWFGLMTHRPATEDYVPVIPWFGVVLIGIFIGQTIQRRPSWQQRLKMHSDHPLKRGLAFAGRHGLLIYVIHQPILFAILWPVAAMLP